MSSGVEEDPEGRARLMAVLGRAQLEDGRLGNIEVVDIDIDVHLLGRFLPRPLRSRIPVDLLEGDGVAIVGADGPPVGVALLHLPVKEGAVELRQRFGVGAVEDDNGVASDSHGLTVKPQADTVRPENQPVCRIHLRRLGRPWPWSVLDS